MGLNEGCLNAGICLADGVGGWPKNVADSINYLNKACDSGNPIACVKLFKIFVDGSGNVSKDGPRAFGFAKQACDQGDMLGCMNAAIMLRKGDGIPKDLKLSEEFREKGDSIRDEIESSKQKQPIVFGEQHK
jgi:TPR repeat protein